MSRSTIDSGARRDFLTGAGATVVASTLGFAPRASAAQSAPAVGSGPSDVAVIGAGAFGAWTALTLRERGAKVTMIDAYGPGNPRATSSGEGRLIRYGYGDQEVYTRWAVKAMSIWKAREKEWGAKLLFPGTRLLLAERWDRSLEAQKSIFDRLSLPYEIVKHDELSHRYPQIGFEGIEAAFVEPDSAMIKAQNAILKVAEIFERRGGISRIGQARPGPASGRRLEAVSLNNNETLRADTFVFSCGPWLRKMFPTAIGKKIATPRCEVAFFGQPAGDTRFSWPNFPYVNDGMSTYPVLDGSGFKVVIPVGRGEVDPDNQERIPTDEQVSRAREWLGVRVPAMKEQPIVDYRVCQFEMTADENFIIDKHPDYDNVWIAGGGSGHGFKHGPVIGEYVAGRVSGDPGDPELRKIFALAGRSDAEANSAPR
jgi:sarcosine oxidase